MLSTTSHCFHCPIIGKIPSTSLILNGPVLYDTTNKKLWMKLVKLIVFFLLLFCNSSSRRPSSALFKEICPGGMGYHVTSHIKPKPVYPQPHQPHPQPHHEPKPQPRPRPPYQEPVLPPVPLPTAHKPVEALSVTERQLPGGPGESFRVAILGRSSW